MVALLHLSISAERLSEELGDSISLEAFVTWWDKNEPGFQVQVSVLYYLVLSTLRT